MLADDHSSLVSARPRHITRPCIPSIGCPPHANAVAPTPAPKKFCPNPSPNSSSTLRGVRLAARATGLPGVSAEGFGRGVGINPMF